MSTYRRYVDANRWTENWTSGRKLEYYILLYRYHICKVTDVISINWLVRHRLSV